LTLNFTTRSSTQRSMGIVGRRIGRKWIAVHLTHSES
jgi:hypothetical protein